MEKEKKIQEAHIYFPVEIYAEIKELAKKERRTINGQVLLMLERALKQNKKRNRQII